MSYITKKKLILGKVFLSEITKSHINFIK